MSRPKIKRDKKERLKTFRKALDTSFQEEKPCLLCGDPEAPNRGIFTSDDLETYTVPAGVCRVATFFLCRSCFNRPGRDALVAEAVKVSFRRQVYPSLQVYPDGRMRKVINVRGTQTPGFDGDGERS